MVKETAKPLVEFRRVNLDGMVNLAQQAVLQGVTQPLAQTGRPKRVASLLRYPHKEKIMKLTVRTEINATVSEVWRAYTTPSDIMNAWLLAALDGYMHSKYADTKSRSIYTLNHSPCRCTTV